MKKCFFGLLLCLAASDLSAADTSFLRDYTDVTNHVSLTGGFIPDTSRIALGEPLFLTFVLSNRSEEPFRFSRVRNEIFTIAATNAAGFPARNSGAHMMDGNGFGKQVVIPPRQEFTERLFNDWCIFDQPGEYTVTCRFLAGEFTGNGPLRRPIVTTFKLTVLPADPERLSAVIDAWSQAVRTNGSLREAVRALASIPDTRTIPGLAILAIKDSEIAYPAVRALARFTNNLFAADALALALKGEDYVAQVAGSALRDFQQADRAASELVPGLANSDPKVRIQTARAVSWTRSERVFAPLCKLLEDVDSSVRYAAAEAIGRLGDARSFGVLTNCLSDADQALRIAAVKGLLAQGRSVEPAWVTPMILSGGENIRAYYEAIDLLRLHGDGKAAPGLASCLHFDDPSVRHAYNFRLILALEFSPNGPKHYYKWHHDPNRDGTEGELAENQRILSEVKAWLENYKVAGAIKPKDR